MKIEIRKEIQSDYQSVREINDAAFGQSVEGNIVDKIRSACDESLSLVAIVEGNVVGHILFSPATIECEGKKIQGMGLGPMAVLPQYQRQGVGSMLVNEGIRILKESKIPFIVVLGHHDYYPRFGFQVASNYGLVPQWDGIPDEAFMVILLNPSVMEKVRGQVKYRPEFDEAT